ncbi:MAG: nuclear transport factor 2 family protein [Chitinophagaceae bacterium]|nr:MAG: nuclear transport factor 2 family protein [Chitinophagaceae bacterium]
MRQILLIFLLCIVLNKSYSQHTEDTAALRVSLETATAMIRKAFADGDAHLVGKLHSLNVIKYFGGSNVIVGRDAVEQGAREWFQNSKVEFLENTIENTEFFGNVAIQTVIFSVRTTPKIGGKPTIARGRSMVIYVRDKNSPSGWLTVREIAQEAPPARP